MTSKLVPPGGFLMPLSTAARELGLEKVDLLEYAEELDGVAPRLRVCFMPTEAQASFARLRPLTGNVGPKMADRGYMVIDPEGQPGFFRSLARNGRGWLGDEALQARIDKLSKTCLVNPGILTNRLVAVEVQLEGLMVPREDIEALKMREAEELSAKRAETLLKIIGALAKLVASYGPAKLGTEEDPNVRAIAAELASDMPGGSPIEGTIANKLNEGLAALNAIGKQKGRKKGRKPGQEAE